MNATTSTLCSTSGFNRPYHLNCQNEQATNYKQTKVTNMLNVLLNDWQAKPGI